MYSECVALVHVGRSTKKAKCVPWVCCNLGALWWNLGQESVLYAAAMACCHYSDSGFISGSIC